MKQQPDGTFIFTSRSGNQATLTPRMNSTGCVMVVDVQWAKTDSASDRRQCDTAFAKLYPSLKGMHSVGNLSTEDRKAIQAHALTHGRLPDEMPRWSDRNQDPHKHETRRDRSLSARC